MRTKSKIAFVSAWGLPISESKDPFCALLLHELIQHGFTVLPEYDSNVNLIVALEHDPLILKKISAQVTRFLVIFEPRIVNPMEYSTKIRSSYTEIFVISPFFKVDESDIQFNYGRALPSIEGKTRNQVHAKKVQTVGLVNANKFSFVDGEMYTLRAKTILHLASEPNLNILVAGAGWKDSKFAQFITQLKCYLKTFRYSKFSSLTHFRNPVNHPEIKFLGSVESAISFLSTVDVALVIENERTYVSEKLFNAIAAGATPIYVGPRLNLMGIPPEIAIECEPNIFSIKDAIGSLDSNKQRAVRQAGLTWLDSLDCKSRWTIESSAIDLASKVNNFFVRGLL